MNGDFLKHPARRDVLAGLGASLVAARTGAIAQPRAWVKPGDAAWPDDARWTELAHAVGGRLAPVTIPQLHSSEEARLLSNPYYLRDQPGLTQSSGWLDAWRSAPSAYAVRARDADDVSAAIRFAAANRVRLAVKGGGHSYLGGSNRPDSLLIWTRDMEEITLHDAFVPAGSFALPVAAVSIGAGCIWGHVYDAVTTRGRRYVQGGGCTTVGVAGLVQGGGFGSFSKRYGLAAASLLEAEIVTADGQIRIISATQEPDLFWALKGGGGGTFGVVTRLTLRTHELPATFGAVRWSLRATSDRAQAALLTRFVDLYAERLFNPHWGEQASARPGNRFDIMMMFQDLSEEAARAAWRPLTDFVAAHPGDYEIEAPLLIVTVPAQGLWDESFLREHLPGVLTADDRPGARPGDWWWTAGTAEVGAFWHGYHSLWLPSSLLQPGARGRFAEAWLAASRRWSTTLHFNKGLAGAPIEAIERSRATAMNPQVLDAFALAIIAMDGRSAYLTPPDLADARDDAARMIAAVGELRHVAPGAGSYLSECDYHLVDWPRAAWGEHWPSLTRIKRRFDPDGLFVVHHGIGG